jgi:hypothetical protein
MAHHVPWVFIVEVFRFGTSVLESMLCTTYQFL